MTECLNTDVLALGKLIHVSNRELSDMYAYQYIKSCVKQIKWYNRYKLYFA